MSQIELAERAGVSLSTVYHIESGRSTRASSIRKVCEIGLDTAPEDLVQTREKQASDPYLLYQASSAIWREEQDRRRAIPDDSFTLIQDPAERRRLGRLGLVGSFMNNPNIVMPDGPGTVFLEIYGRREGAVNAGVYRDSKLYCQSGGVRCAVGEHRVELRAGDMIGYTTADLRWIEPLELPVPNEEPSRLLWMGAVRIGKTIRGDRRTIVRKSRKAP